jgi:hypothetical protein
MSDNPCRTCQHFLKEHWMLIRTDHGKVKDFRKDPFLSNDLEGNPCPDFETS